MKKTRVDHKNRARSIPSLTVLSAAIFISSSAIAVQQPLLPGENVNHHTWMENVFQDRANTRIIDMVIPGTHDSGAYRFTGINTDGSEFRGKSKAIQDGLRETGSRAVGRWGEAHNIRVNTQLHNGNRLFDIRVEMLEGELYVYHGLAKMVPFHEVLVDIAAFSANHPKEMIMLDIRSPASNVDRDRMDLMIRQNIGQYLVPIGTLNSRGGNIETLEIGDIWNTGKNVIILDKTDDHYFTSIRNLSHWWPKSSVLVDISGGTLKMSENLKRIRNGYDGKPGILSRPDNRLHSASITLTATTNQVIGFALFARFDDLKDAINDTVETIADAIVPGLGSLIPGATPARQGLPNSLEQITRNKLARVSGKAVYNLVVNSKENEKTPNFLLGDYNNITGMSAAAIAMNWPEIPTPNEKLELKRVNSFSKIWDDVGSGAEKNGSIWQAVQPDGGYKLLGHTAIESHGKPSHAYLVKDTNNGALVKPLGFVKTYADIYTGTDVNLTTFRPIAPKGYTCMGDVAISELNADSSSSKLDALVDQLRCVHNSYLTDGIAQFAWTSKGSGGTEDIAFSSANTASDSRGIAPGTFVSNPNRSQNEIGSNVYPLSVFNPSRIKGEGIQTWGGATLGWWTSTSLDINDVNAHRYLLDIKESGTYNFHVNTYNPSQPHPKVILLDASGNQLDINNYRISGKAQGNGNTRESLSLLKGVYQLILTTDYRNTVSPFKYEFYAYYPSGIIFQPSRFGKVRSKLGTCVDIPEGNAYEGANIHSWKCNQARAQNWVYTQDGTLRPQKNANLCLDVTSNNNTLLWTCHNGKNQKWSFVGHDAEYGRLTPYVDKDEALDVYYGESNNGRNLQVHNWNIGRGQLWNLTR